MAVRLIDLIDNLDIRRRFFRESADPAERVLYEQTTYDGLTPTDMYYQKLGELVEKHPIVSARVRRG